ncbi:hypothetical protein MLD38_024895 [Melastoma candidum]|uniref:Uncharacterized protein n=1 Tax=Melastoma candidum TaxID=119954 RepID=A0ACB9NTT3_9MYRT|nr:hypothetical protein MLD38_024895 [Melastoma candidum]
MTSFCNDRQPGHLLNKTTTRPINQTNLEVQENGAVQAHQQVKPNPFPNAEGLSSSSGKISRTSRTIACMVLNLTYLLKFWFLTTTKYRVTKTRKLLRGNDRKALMEGRNG